MRRLDRVADGVNPFLIILMVGLLILIVIRVATMGLVKFSNYTSGSELSDFTGVHNQRCRVRSSGLARSWPRPILMGRTA